MAYELGIDKVHGEVIAQMDEGSFMIFHNNHYKTPLQVITRKVINAT